MTNLIIEVSKYLLIIFMIIYTVQSFTVFTKKSKSAQEFLYMRQVLMILLIHFIAFMVLYLKMEEEQLMFFWGSQAIYLLAVQVMVRNLYPQASKLLLNNMCMLLSVGFIMLCRLDISAAQKQLLIAAGASGIALIIPVMIRKMRFLRKLTWVYAGIGIVLLGAVFALARTSYGAKLSLMGIQPSEVIKITFVFFMASLLCTKVDFRKVVLATIVAVIHVGILVLSRDLGSAVIFFVTYLVLIYVATRNPSYLFLGLGGG